NPRCHVGRLAVRQEPVRRECLECRLAYFAGPGVLLGAEREVAWARAHFRLAWCLGKGSAIAAANITIITKMTIRLASEIWTTLQWMYLPVPPRFISAASRF